MGTMETKLVVALNIEIILPPQEDNVKRIMTRIYTLSLFITQVSAIMKEQYIYGIEEGDQGEIASVRKKNRIMPENVF
jgi:hypothetical protein